MNGNIVEKYVRAGRFSFIENEIFCEFLWLEKGCTYYLYHCNTADVPYKINLTFLGDLVSSEIENDVIYIDGTDPYAGVHVDPTGIFGCYADNRFTFVFSNNAVHKCDTVSVAFDSFEPGERIMTVDLFNGHGPSFDVTLIDVAAQIDRIEVPNKDYLYAIVSEDGEIKSFRTWPKYIKVYFIDGSEATLKDQTGVNMPSTEYDVTLPDGTEIVLEGHIGAGDLWGHSDLYSALNDAVNKTLDPNYEDEHFCIYYTVTLEGKETPLVKERIHFIKYSGLKKSNTFEAIISTVISYMALPFFVLLRPISSSLPISVQDSLSSIINSFYYRYIL